MAMQDILVYVVFVDLEDDFCFFDGCSGDKEVWLAGVRAKAEEQEFKGLGSGGVYTLDAFIGALNEDEINMHSHYAAVDMEAQPTPAMLRENRQREICQLLTEALNLAQNNTERGEK